MHDDGIRFGIDTLDGQPFISTCRGSFKFPTVEQAAAFASARILIRLQAYASIYDSFDPDVEASAGQRDQDRDIPL
jgi:hypothetical protein